MKPEGYVTFTAQLKPAGMDDKTQKQKTAENIQKDTEKRVMRKVQKEVAYLLISLCKGDMTMAVSNLVKAFGRYNNEN